MDIGKDIAYHIRRVWEKETAIFPKTHWSFRAERSEVEKPRCPTRE